MESSEGLPRQSATDVLLLSEDSTVKETNNKKKVDKN